MKKTKIKTTKWDVVDYLMTDGDMAEYLEAAMEDGHPAVIVTAIGNIARAKGYKGAWFTFSCHHLGLESTRSIEVVHITI